MRLVARLSFMLAALLLAGGALAQPAAPALNTGDLLRRLTDLDRLTQWPAEPERTVQFSSYDRGSEPAYRPERGAQVLPRPKAANPRPPTAETIAGFRPSASFGAASFPLHGRTTVELLKVADDALYRAKQRGGDEIVTFAA